MVPHSKIKLKKYLYSGVTDMSVVKIEIILRHGTFVDICSVTTMIVTFWDAGTHCYRIAVIRMTQYIVI